MHQLYVLYEHASGYAIFRTTEFEEVAVFLPQVRESILNISKFRSNVFFVTYQSFKEQKDALHNMQEMISGELCTDIQLFLENNVPRSKKSKQPVVLGVEDPDFAAVISDKLGIKCIASGLVQEIIRGIRFHFYKLIKGFKDEESAVRAQLALAHKYSRIKLNFDANRQDCMVIESSNLVDDLEKDVNILGKRIRKWYAFHFPELFKVIPHNNELYIQCVNVIGNRKNMPKDIKERLSAIVNDPVEVENILQAAHHSMGSDISAIDLENLKMLCERAISLMNRRQSSIQYLKNKLNNTAPNLSVLVGDMVASRLITRAGGLEKLARLPSSTVQVLGADKKFFRTLKDRKQKPLICGLLSNSAFMGKAGKKKKGRLARMLANKSCLAARVDCFRKIRSLEPSFGEKLVQEVESGIKFIKNVNIQEKNSNKNEETSNHVKTQKRRKSLKRKAGNVEQLHKISENESKNLDRNASQSSEDKIIESSQSSQRYQEHTAIDTLDEKVDSSFENSSGAEEDMLSKVSIQKKSTSKKMKKNINGVDTKKEKNSVTDEEADSTFENSSNTKGGMLKKASVKKKFISKKENETINDVDMENEKNSDESSLDINLNNCEAKVTNSESGIEESSSTALQIRQKSSRKRRKPETVESVTDLGSEGVVSQQTTGRRKSMRRLTNQGKNNT